jgi:hypothetical protein
MGSPSFLRALKSPSLSRQYYFSDGYNSRDAVPNKLEKEGVGAAP